MTDDDLLDCKHHGVAPPSGTFDDPTLWKYMDILSLFSILHNECLHFSRLSELHRFDPNEGTGGLSINVENAVLTPSSFSIPITVESIARNRRELRRVKNQLNVAHSVPISKWREQVKKWDRSNKNVFISCWHTNEHESDFMWRVYAKYEYGFAITSHRRDLLGCFENMSREKVGCDYVAYPTLDELFQHELHRTMGPDAAFLIKHRDFVAEREFRLFVRSKQPTKSCDLKVSLQKLVKGVHISPLVPEWAEDALFETLRPICDAKCIPLFRRRKPRLRNAED